MRDGERDGVRDGERDGGSKFWVFDSYETFICFREVLNLSFYISKKVQKNFLMGLKIW